MAILIDPTKRVLVQGIAGREGAARTRLMKEGGTQVLAGVAVGQSGVQEGVPVFDTVGAAVEALGRFDVSVLFIAAPLVRAAALEALMAGIPLLVIVSDRVPLYDVLDIAAEAGQRGARFIGPNTLGVLSPGQGVLGTIGGRAAGARQWFVPGPVGVTSRSGGMTTSIAYYLARSGSGLSTLVHVGGDSVVGMTHADVLRQFEADPQTECVVLYGEIGTSQEESAADLIDSGGFTKPLVAYVGGQAATGGTRFSHAGAIIDGGRGTYEGKVARLREAGAQVVESFADIPSVTAQLLGRKTISLPSGNILVPGFHGGVSSVQSPLPPVAQSPTPTEKNKPNVGYAANSATPTTAGRSAPANPQEQDAGDLRWKTAILRVRPNEIRLRGYRVDELMARASFSQTIFLALTGELPTPQIGRLLDAIFVSSIDHGAASPAALAARTTAGTGAPYNAALAVGLLSIDQHPNGAVEDAMRMILRALELARVLEGAGQIGATALVAAYRKERKPLPGFGHLIHAADPRTKRLLEMADGAGVSSAGVTMLRAIGEAWTEQGGPPLPVNLDGAIAALLVDLRLPIELASAFLMIARLPGLVAQVHEEKTREQPLRAIHPTDHDYDGPADRSNDADR